MSESNAADALLKLHNPKQQQSAPCVPTLVHAWPVPTMVHARPISITKRSRQTPASELLYRGSNSVSLHALADELCRRTPNTNVHADIRGLCIGYAMNLMTLDCFCALMIQVTPTGVFQNLSKDLTRVATLRARWRLEYTQHARARARRRARQVAISARAK